MDFKLYRQFQEITLNVKLRDLALEHATKRTKQIIRQFVPQNAPLTPLESNYVGSIGEIAVRKYLKLNTTLDDNYDKHQVDDGDVEWNGLIYDVKTDAIPSSIYKNLHEGTIKAYDTYGCRVFSAKHLHHLKKYNGGLIFCAFKIPDNARETKIERTPDWDIKNIRKNVFENDKALIIGIIEQARVADNPPTWYTPKNPETGRQSQYNSPNYIFHHTALTSIASII